MRQTLSIILAITLCNTAFASGVKDIDFSTVSDRWELRSTENLSTGSTSKPLEYYAIESISYCSKPVAPAKQVMNIYVPAEYMQEGGKKGKYTANTAPIIYYNTSGGYASSSPINPDMKRPPEGYYADFLDKGYVLVGIGTRGKETVDDNGKPNGSAPAIITDLKAGIRYLKYNDNLIPGDANKIVSIGYSSGGAVSTMLGASGNSPLYEPLLKEIGAAPASDDIFIAFCYCPMANLNIADASFEWYHHTNHEYDLFSSLGGGHHQLTPFEIALSRELQRLLVRDLQRRGIDITDDGRGGLFYTSFVSLYEDGIAGYVNRFCKTAKEKKEFLDKLDPNGKWLEWDDKSGTAKIDYDSFDHHYLIRRKSCPSFDAFDYRSNERNVFGDSIAPSRHYSLMVLEAISNIESQYPEEAKKYKEEYRRDITPEVANAVNMMSAINFVAPDVASDVAPYWRFRVGSEDADQGIIAAHILAAALRRRNDAEVDEGVIWGLHHTAAEYSLDDLSEYIDKRSENITKPSLRVGASKVSITPTPDMFPVYDFHGHDYIGVHDSLYVRTIVLEQRDTRVVMAEIDATTVPEPELLTRIAAQTANVPESNVMICASHTHSTLHADNRDSLLIRKGLEQSVKQALLNMQPAEMSFGRSSTWVAVNNGELAGRNAQYDIEGFTDPTLDVVRINSRQDSSPIAMVCNFASHGEVMFNAVCFNEATDKTGFEVTGDLPGAVSRILEESPKGAPVVLSTNGAEGDQLPLFTASTRTQNLGSHNFGSEGYAVLEVLATRVADDVLSTPMTQANRSEELSVQTTFVTVPGQKWDRETRTATDTAPVDIPVTLINVGNIMFECIGADLAALIGTEIRNSAPATHTMLITNTAGSVGYVLEDKAYKNPGHGVMGSRVKPGYVKSAVIEEVNKLKKTTTIVNDAK